MNPSQKTFVALDNLSLIEVQSLLPKLRGKVFGIKIGLEMYLKHGRQFVDEAKRQFEGAIFLDLKLHDIPNTVAKAIHSLKALPIDFLTVHAGGGEQMLKAARDAANESLPHTKILAVSVLTSLDDRDCEEIFGVGRTKAFERLVKLVVTTQTGLVCSGAELPMIKGQSIISMVPGIRFESEIKSGKTQDQKSVFTPRQAIEMGASFIVVGRSLTQADDLDEALKLLDA